MKVIINKAQFNMNIIFTYVWIFLTIFGPKLYSFIDISALLNILLIIIVMRKGKITIHKVMEKLLFLLLFIIGYALLISVLNNGLDFIFIFKFARVFLAILGIGSILYESKLTRIEIINIVVNVLLIHAVIVVVSSTIFMDLQEWLRPFSGYDKAVASFRSTGLTNGFDISGLLCIVGFLIVGEVVEINSKRIIKSLIFVFASFLTSRGNMLLMIIALAYSIFFCKTRSLREKRIFIYIGCVFLIPILGIVLYSLNYRENGIVQNLMKSPFFVNVFESINKYYAISDVGYAVDSNFDFSKLSFLQMIFGSMHSSEQDPGYTQYIYYIGVVGLSAVLLFYGIIIYNSRKIKRIKLGTGCLVRSINFIVFLNIAGSIKISYLLSRHITEILIILVVLVNRKENFNYEKGTSNISDSSNI